MKLWLTLKSAANGSWCLPMVFACNASSHFSSRLSQSLVISNFLILQVVGSKMIDDFESKGVRSSGELWSEICSNLPELQDGQAANAQFTDSFQPSAQNTTQANGNHSNSTFSPWEPMADSEIYIASLGTRSLSN